MIAKNSERSTIDGAQSTVSKNFTLIYFAFLPMINGDNNLLMSRN